MVGAARRKKIAILGGGVGAMAAACSLTERPNWQDDFEVTVYQLGWRLGGKGASGRNLNSGARIEEHGLHIWLGFYHNAFGLIRRCYDDLARPEGGPLATWQDAFKPHSFIVLEEKVQDDWVHFPVEFATNDREPGEAVEPPTVWGFVLEILERMRDHFEHSPFADREGKVEVETSLAVADKPRWWDRLSTRFDADFETLVGGAAHRFLDRAVRLARSLHADVSLHSAEEHHALLWLLDRFHDWMSLSIEPLVAPDEGARRLFVFLDMGHATVRGLIRDGVIHEGFDAMDGEDYRDWFRRHGANELTMASPWMWAFNDLAFAFRDGSTNQPDAAAGTTLRACLRMVFDYRGAFMWKMQAGMGDTIFAPMYELLKRRGVKFHFFHRVTGLHPADDGTSIDRISMSRQVTLKHGEYDPLVPILGLPCWPSEPLYDQIVEGEALRQEQINLESSWTHWQDVEPIMLRRGVDFDDVVLGISLGALPTICTELIALKQAWQQMVDNVKTVRTQAFQLWLKPRLAELGWALASPIMTTYVEPHDTWADMSHLLEREIWEGGVQPGNVAYFCGPLEDSEEPPLFSDRAFPARINAQVRDHMINWIEQHIGYLWPDATHVDHGGLLWDLLVHPQEREGRERFSAQYWRANIDPSERYVLSTAGSTRYRLRSDQSGFTNLYLAGDWTRNGLNAGCVEAAVMSGMQASRAICGSPAQIIGEEDRIEQ